MEIFKGYVKCNGKTPIKKGYLTSYDTLECVSDCESYAGILSDGIVLFDVDSNEEGELLFNIVKDLGLNTVVHKTDRGYHFFFKWNKDEQVTHCPVPLGIECDTKVGGKGIACLKLDGKVRRKLYGTDDIQELPKFLIPNYGLKKIYAMTEGTRNDTLFKNMIPLKKSGWSLQEIHQLYQLINQRVLKDPLTDRELEVILRPEAYTGISPNKKGFTNDDLISIYDTFERTYYPRKCADLIWIWEGNKWVGGDCAVKHSLLQIENRLSSIQRNEIYNRAYDSLQESYQNADPNSLWLANGILNMRTMELQPLSPQIFSTAQLPWDWNADAYDKEMDEFLQSISDDDDSVRALIEEMIGYCFTSSVFMQKAFILIGDKSNGKSTLLSIIRSMIGPLNYSTLDLNDLDNQFRLSNIVGKIVNLGSDISDVYLEDISIFKKIVTGDALTVEFKHKNSFNHIPCVKMIFSANQIPQFRDPTGAGMRRLILIPFTRTFDGAKYPNKLGLEQSLITPNGMSYLIKLGVEGLKRLWKNKKFTDCEKAEDSLKRLQYDTNPMYSFLSVTPITSIIGHSREEVYSRYALWSETYGFKPLGLPNFTKQLVMITADLSTRVNEDKTISFISTTLTDLNPVRNEPPKVSDEHLGELN
jgi:putative DNA primase/helicase